MPTTEDQTIASIWETYNSQVLPEHASEHQRRETRTAVYAGAHAMFHMMGQITELPDAQAVEAIRKLRLESEAWVAECEAMAAMRGPR